MTKKKVEICLEFTQVNVFGELIPSKTLFNKVVDRYPNNRDKQTFCLLSNIVIQELNDLVSSESERIKVFKTLAISANLSYPKLIQSFYITQWLIYIQSNFTGGNRQELERETAKRIRVKQGKLPADKLMPVTGGDYPELKQYVELQIADNYIELFICKTRYLHSLHIELYGIFGRKSVEGRYVFTCPYCQKIQLVPNGKKPSDCGGKRCRSKYRKNWEMQNRPTTGRDPVGWIISFGGIPQECQGEKCLFDLPGKRQVNDGSICRTCFVKT